MTSYPDHLAAETTGIDISESEATLRAMTEASPSAIFIYQGDRYRYVNPAMEAVTGYTRLELLSSNFWDVIHPDFREMVRQRGLARQRGEPVPQRYELKIIHKSCEERWVDFTGTQIEYKGAPAVLGTAFDITERKKAEEALQQTEAALRRRAEQLAVLHALSLDITSPLDLDTLLKRIVDRAVELLKATGGSIWLEGQDEPSQHQTVGVKVPMSWQGRVIGTLEVIDDREDRQFTQEDCELLTLFSSQAAIAIENARLFARATTEQSHLSLLYDLGRELAASVVPDQILERAITLTCQVLEGFRGQAYTYLPDEDRLTVSAIYKPGILSRDELNTHIHLHLGQGIVGWVTQQRQSVYVPDVLEDDRWVHFEGVDEDVRAVMCAPIIADGRLLGALSVFHSQSGAFSSRHLTLLQTICQELGLALSNATRYQQLQRQLAEITLIQNLAQTFNRRSELQELLNEVATQLLERLGYPLVEIFLIEGDTLVQRAISGLQHTADQIPLSQGVVGRVARTGVAALVADVHQDPDYIPSFNDTISELAVPIFHGTVVVGVINIETRLAGQLTVQDLDILEVLAGQISIALENAVLYDTLRRHAANLEHVVIERTAELVELYELSQEIGYTLSNHELLKMLLSHLRNALRSDLVVGGLFMDGQRLLYVETTRPLTPICMSSLHAYWLDVLRTQELYTPDYDQIPIEVVPAETFSASEGALNKIASLINAPVMVAGDVVGMLIAGCERGKAFGEAQQRILDTFANQAAAAIQRLAAMLAAEQQRLESLVEHLPVGVLLLDSDNHLLLANPLGREILEVLNNNLSDGQLTHLGTQSLADLFANQEEALPVEIVQPGAATRVFEAQARPAGKEGHNWLLTLREVTHEREYQTRIQRQERLATVGQLAAGIAHDFNNIMAAILVYADLLTEDPEIPDVSRDRLLIIQQQVQRAASLIRQILDFSRRSVMEQSDLDLLPFVKEIDKMLRRVLPETIQLELTYRSGSYLVHADPTRLQQAFMNLALNARDALPEGGLIQYELNRIVVKPGERPPMTELSPGEWVRITVKDSGMGIRPEHIPHIFEPFFTTKPVGQGTGLGLAQVYGIIKQHDGFIDVKSQPGAGTTFVIYLPALTEHQLSEPVISSTARLSGMGKAVLVVEDDHATREALHALLEAHQYAVQTAANGMEALDRLEKDHSTINLVISDVVMPQMGGLALYHAIREHWPTIKILFITGHPLEGENQKLLEKGQVMWLQKPFSAQSFNQVVYSLLEG